MIYALRFWLDNWHIAVGYWLRSILYDPAPSAWRCCMGSTVHPAVWCPRTAYGEGLWCVKHLGI